MNIIKKRRKEKGLTQKALAEQIGVNTRWVQKLEAGEIKVENITLLNAVKLMDALASDDIERYAVRDMYMLLKGITIYADE